MSYTSDDFKRTLGYGSRLNLFEVDLKFPAALTDAQVEEQFKILCVRSTFPGSRTITPIEIPFEGDYIKIAGEKEAEEEITFAFRMNQNYKVRDLFEQWVELVHADKTGLRSTPDIYKTDWCIIKQLNHEKEAIRQVKCYGVWPSKVNNLEFDKTATDLAETEITLQLDNHEFIYSSAG